MRAHMRFAGCDEADLFSRELEASFDGVLAKNYVSDPAKGPLGFVAASVDGRPWHDTMWSRDVGTFLRELTHYGAWHEAKNVLATALDHLDRSEDGFLSFPEYFRMGQRASGTELDGTAATVISAVLLRERLPRTDHFRRIIADFLVAPSSPVRYMLHALARQPFIAGSGEFGGGGWIEGSYYNVVQNALAAWALEAVARHLDAEDAEGAALQAHCAEAAGALTARLVQYFLAGDGTWLWCLDPATTRPDHAINAAEINRGSGGINGVLTYAADVHGLQPLACGEPWVLPCVLTFLKLMSQPTRLEQFQRHGMWTQFDDFGFTPISRGLFTGPSYGHGYALQAMLLLDRPELYSKAANWLAWATGEPGYPVDRGSPYWFLERYYSPDISGQAGLQEGCGALNLVNVSEPLKVARLMIGLDDHALDPVRIVPRLPIGWTYAELSGLPIRTVGGHALLDLRIEADGSGAILRVCGESTSPLPALRVRLGTASNADWRTYPAGGRAVG